MDGQAEKRQLPRYPVEFPVTCRIRGQQQQGRALNLSRGGVLVSTADLLPVGAFAEVSLVVPDGEVIQFKGIVRHTTQEMGMGIEFLEILPNHQARIAAYLDSLRLAPASDAN